MVHPGYLGCPTKRFDTQDDFIFSALYGVKGQLHCLIPLHALTLDAWVQDPARSVLGRLTSTLGGSWMLDFTGQIIWALLLAGD